MKNLPFINTSEYRQNVVKENRIEEEEGRNKLDRILNANKTTKNNMRIYSEEELIEISKFNLDPENYLRKVKEKKSLRVE